MAAEPVQRMIDRSARLPPGKRREYLIVALKAEKTAARRARVTEVLRQITTQVLRGGKS